MILRRITQHVKAQNWTAVALDFVIVVVGVFIGIQVSNWNDARAELAAERHLLTRLHEETRALLEIQKAEYAKHLPRAEALIAVHALLFSPAPSRSLSETECRFIGVSHWLPAPTDELPILEEAVATGGADLISDDNVKARVHNFALVRDRYRRQYAESVNELYRLTSRHPHAVWYLRRPVRADDDPALIAGRDAAQLARRAGDGFRWAYECNMEAMRGDKAFLADYVDNVSRLNSFVDRYEDMIAVLAELENALADELDVSASREARTSP